MNECYRCKHRDSVHGSAHSSCKVADSAVLLLLAMTGRGPLFNPHGIRNGWASWPIDFDPVWLESCNYFEPKE